MRSIYLVPIAGLLILAACNDTKKPSEMNFTKAINKYLAKHGETCALIGRQFPIDVLCRNNANNMGSSQSWPL
jgi:predicted HAD superfamily phosphohydrolase YqeG